MERACVECGEIKPLDQFIQRKTPQGVLFRTIGCRDCFNKARQHLRFLSRGKSPLSRQERFEQYVEPIPWTGCWIWTGSLYTSLGKHACGQFNWDATVQNHKNEPSHRSAWKIYRGEIPEGLYVCHVCDNRLCVNPYHLFLGTHQDNMDDMMKKGRHPVINRGSKHAQSKLREEDVLYIRASQERSGELAKRFGVTQTNINFVRRRISWKHLETV